MGGVQSQRGSGVQGAGNSLPVQGSGLDQGPPGMAQVQGYQSGPPEEPAKYIVDLPKLRISQRVRLPAVIGWLRRVFVGLSASVWFESG